MQTVNAVTIRSQRPFRAASGAGKPFRLPVSDLFRAFPQTIAVLSSTKVNLGLLLNLNAAETTTFKAHLTNSKRSANLFKLYKHKRGERTRVHILGSVIT